MAKVIQLSELIRLTSFLLVSIDDRIPVRCSFEGDQDDLDNDDYVHLTNENNNEVIFSSNIDIILNVEENELGHPVVILNDKLKAIPYIATVVKL